jgi:hypothetical protein
MQLTKYLDCTAINEENDPYKHGSFFLRSPKRQTSHIWEVAHIRTIELRSDGDRPKPSPDKGLRKKTSRI